MYKCNEYCDSICDFCMYSTANKEIIDFVKEYK